MTMRTSVVSIIVLVAASLLSSHGCQAARTGFFHSGYLSFSTGKHPGHTATFHIGSLVFRADKTAKMRLPAFAIESTALDTQISIIPDPIRGHDSSNITIDCIFKGSMLLKGTSPKQLMNAMEHAVLSGKKVVNRKTIIITQMRIPGELVTLDCCHHTNRKLFCIFASNNNLVLSIDGGVPKNSKIPSPAIMEIVNSLRVSRAKPIGAIEVSPNHDHPYPGPGRGFLHR